MIVQFRIGDMVTYGHNRPGRIVAVRGDYLQVERLDVFTGGFPCTFVDLAEYFTPLSYA